MTPFLTTRTDRDEGSLLVFPHDGDLTMIDIHTHVLPGFDDGPVTTEESLDMLRLAEEDGIGVVFATPHSGFLVGKSYGKKQIQDAVARLGEERRSLDGRVEIMSGVEAHLTAEIEQDIVEGRAFTLNESRYLLLELPFFSYPIHTEQIVITLREARGLIPIIAHPERLAYFQTDPDLLRRLLKLGAMAQLTGGSLTGRFGPTSKATSRIMLEHGWVQFLASDAHDRDHRLPRLSEAARAAAEFVGPEEAQRLVVENPRAVLEDTELEANDPLPYTARRRWFA